MQLAFADLLQVFLKGHPAIHDHRGPKLFARPLLQRIQHLIQAAPVLRIAVEDFVALGKPSRSTTNPTTTCLQSGRLSREYPRLACGLAVACPSKYVDVKSYR